MFFMKKLRKFCEMENENFTKLLDHSKSTKISEDLYQFVNDFFASFFSMPFLVCFVSHYDHLVCLMKTFCLQFFVIFVCVSLKKKA